MAVKLNYEGIVNLLSNPFAENAMDVFVEYFPFTFDPEGKEQIQRQGRVTMQDLQQLGLMD